MESIKVEYFTKQEDGEKYIYLKAIDEQWSGSQGSYIFMEISESLLRSSYQNICFDLSGLRLISSSYLGAIMNLATGAKEQKKNIKFLVNKSNMETLKLASIDKVVTVEETQ